MDEFADAWFTALLEAIAEVRALAVSGGDTLHPAYPKAMKAMADADAARVAWRERANAERYGVPVTHVDQGPIPIKVQTPVDVPAFLRAQVLEALNGQ